MQSFEVSEQEINSILDFFTQKTGIIPRESHILFIKNFIQKRKEELGLKNTSSYFDYLRTNVTEIEFFINNTTVNETYFFREQAQFNFLKEFFNSWQKKYGAKQISVWSAACSNGEEAYSILLVSKQLHINCNVTATDINSDSIKNVQKAEYSKKSLRLFDGKDFHFLCEPYTVNEKIIFPPEFKNNVKTNVLNLLELTELNKNKIEFPKEQNIIFLRNVFIYFTSEVKKQILHFICDNCLAKDGIILVSVSEIASIDSSILPVGVKRKSFGNVYYFQKEN